MPFYPYIILDGFRYKTLAKQWRPTTIRPVQARITLAGRLTATFGAAALKRWDGIISAPSGEAVPPPAIPGETVYGTIENLRATLRKHEQVKFTDHYGTVYWFSTILGPFEEESLQNIWNAPTNKFLVRVSIMAEAG
jgi:hypothetical protein